MESESPSKRRCVHDIRVFGQDVLANRRLNKGLAFSADERQVLGIEGFLPARIMTQEEQIQSVMRKLSTYTADLHKYDFLMSVLAENERLFYAALEKHVERLMPIVYTPVVGLACQNYADVYRPGLGLYITINDMTHIDDVLSTWPEKTIQAIVVTDEERILGLGDMGVYGMGIPIGKLALYTLCAGVDPRHCLPITLDVGTNNENLIQDPDYFGLRQKRITGEPYDKFMKEIMEAIVKRYGPHTLIQFEDFATSNAFKLLDLYKKDYLCFNDDIEGTASVAVAGVIAALRVKNEHISKQRFVFLGAGEAAIGIAELLVEAMCEEGTVKEQARRTIFLVDSKGLVVKNRPTGGLNVKKEIFAHELEPLDSLEEVVTLVKPSVLIGVSAQAGAFTETILQKMGEYHHRPIIFALSNPTEKSECTAEQAYQATNGRAIFASGSPCDLVRVGDRELTPGQGNNAYVFPGISLSAILFKVNNLPTEVFLKAAQLLADMVTEQDLERGLVYPPLTNIREVSIRLASGLGEFYYTHGMATLYPRPERVEDYVRSCLYKPDYETVFLPTWSGPPGAILPSPGPVV